MKTALFAIGLLLSAIPSISGAQTAAPDQNFVIDGVDLTPVADELKKGIFVLEKPVHVYHYFQGGGNWQSAYSADDPAGRQYVSGSSGSYWAEQGKRDGGNAMGFGLYAAIDPVVSRSYGGQSYVMMRLELPVGFRFITTLRKSGQGEFSKPAKAALKSLGCLFRSLTGEARDLEVFMGSKQGSSQRCIDGLRVLVKDKLGVEGLLYRFPGAEIKECTDYFFRRGAFVIMSDGWLERGGNVRVFTAQTPDARDERLKIASLANSANLSWPDTSEHLPAEEVSAWVQSTFLGCGQGQWAKAYPEVKGVRD